MSATLLLVLVLFQQGLWMGGSDVGFEVQSPQDHAGTKGLVVQWALAMNKTVVMSGTQAFDPEKGSAAVSFKAPKPRVPVEMTLNYKVLATPVTDAQSKPIEQGTRKVWVAPEPDLAFVKGKLSEAAVVTLGGDAGPGAWLKSRGVASVALEQANADGLVRVVITRARDVGKEESDQLMKLAQAGALILVYGQPGEQVTELLGHPLMDRTPAGKLKVPANLGPCLAEMPAGALLEGAFKHGKRGVAVGAAKWAIAEQPAGNPSACVSLTAPVVKGWVCLALTDDDNVRTHPVVQKLVSNALALAIDRRAFDAPEPVAPAAAGTQRENVQDSTGTEKETKTQIPQERSRP